MTSANVPLQERAGASSGQIAARLCAVCDGRMRPTRHAWCFRCPACGFLAASLPPHIGDATADDAVDEERREKAFLNLRRKNFERILDVVGEQMGPVPCEGLEAGCAHGWFLEAAARRGYSMQGIEPDAPTAAAAAAAGHDVTVGFFPDDLVPNRRYSLIVFNDVFEHLPDPRAALAACRDRLRPRGLLVLNLPNSRGTLFRTAALFDSIGLSGPYERLWQKGFPSPHLSYFHPAALSRLAGREGFAEIHRGRLVSLDIGGLWQRLRYNRSTGIAASAFLWCGIALAAPFLRVLPGDISLQIFRAPG
jgi:2-polyprenyl-3-methyl-5-hydroxy-6-metoxy-1,4-benzoquinol methylase